jgi:outer membrane protein
MKKTIFSLFILSTFIFQSCTNKPKDTTAAAPTTATTVPESVAVSAAMSASKVAFVNIDSLKEQYTWFKQQQASFQAREKSIMTSLEGKAQQLQTDAMALQRKAEAGTTPPAQLQQEEQQLMQRQQQIAQDRDRRGQALLEETSKFNEALQKKLDDVLAQIQKEKGFDYVVSYSKAGGSPFLYVNPALNVTTDVVKILNAKKEQ